MLALVAMSLMAIMALSAYAVNSAYMELSRSELRLANDAAAKAAITSLGQTQSVTSARATAKTVAANFTIAGKTYSLNDSDIEFGNSSRQSDGTYQFVLNGTPINSVRVNGGSSTANQAMAIGSSKFSLSNQTIATRVDHDVCFVIDRSGSMAWDMSNVKFSYPGDMNGKSRLQNYFTPPHATLSRWAALQGAVNEFNNVVSLNSLEVRAGLVTYSSNYEFGKYKSVQATTNRDLTATLSQIPADLVTIGKSPIIGDTNIAAGLTAGVNLLSTSTSARMTATKTIILLSDGVKTDGGDPTTIAAAAKAANIRVHTIAFSAQADAWLMQSLASAGGGNYYFATDTATLHAAFRQIAESIPSIITK